MRLDPAGAQRMLGDPDWTVRHAALARVPPEVLTAPRDDPEPAARAAVAERLAAGRERSESTPPREETE